MPLGAWDEEEFGEVEHPTIPIAPATARTTPAASSTDVLAWFFIEVIRLGRQN